MIQKADLPALIRARCYMVLSTVESNEAVKFAKTAVNLIDVDVRELVVPQAFPENQLTVAKECLQDAEERKRVKDAGRIKGKKSDAKQANPSATAAITSPIAGAQSTAPVPGAGDVPVSLTGFGNASGFMPTPGPSRNTTGKQLLFPDTFGLAN